MRRFLFILMVAVLVLAGIAAAAGAAPARPFSGAMVSGWCTFQPDASSPTGMWAKPYGTGTASHMGATVMTARHPAALAFTDGHMRLTAANGDRVCIEYAGEGPMPTYLGQVYDVYVDGTIVGGTGRFAGASGSVDMTVTLTFLGLEVPSWPETAVWTGTITY